MIYKDVNNSGRTLVHHSQCPNLGLRTNADCLDNVKCGMRHQSESMRVGIIDKLRKGFEEVGKKGPYDPVTHLADPTHAKHISRVKKGGRRLKVRQRSAMYAYCYAVFKRLAGAGHVIAPNTIRIPYNGGLVFSCTWDKTLNPL